ncbi:secretion protein EspA [Winslowiella iniecta]|uniref:secretion protein EspA n=1 Tax=Winslowiella iniecta TaxID=1560201 RepID=UPI00069F9156|nr:secretion protein EspA [Winslowiella iniecta]
MIAINNVVSLARSESPVFGQSVSDIDYLRAGSNTSLMGTAMVSMENIMLLFTELANAKFEQMSKKTEVSRDAQDMANRVDALLASLADAKGTAELPPDVIAYMRENNIEVNGMSIDKFIAENGTTLNKADLTAVKSALESHSGRASDFVQQNQLKLQQLMQNFNTAVTMANSIQSMNAESTKSIAQSIR